MPLYPDTLDVFVDWARAEFAREIDTGFARMRMFDSPIFQIVFSALIQQSPAQLALLSRALPEPRKERLSAPEKQAFEAFDKEKTRIYKERHIELSRQITGFLEKPYRDEMLKIRSMAGGIFKEIAGHWNCRIQKEEPAIWMLTRTESWGSIRMEYDLHEAVEFAYSLTISHSGMTGLPRRDHYLGSLGIMGRSAILLTSAQTCAEKLWKVSELIHWQVNEYAGIMKHLS